MNYFESSNINIDPQVETGADTAISLLGRAILPKAVVLARAGKYPEAEYLLQHLIQEGGATPAIYDLMARIRAQQGRLLEAQAFWAEAIRLSSSRELYRAALKQIEQLQARPAWVNQLRKLLLGFSLFLGVMLIIATTRLSLNGLKISTIKSIIPRRSRPAAINPGIKKPKVMINIPGVLIDTQNDQILITFKSGLFLNNTEFTPEAETTLDVLAEQLKPYAGLIQVNVEGHTDDIPVSNGWTYRDNAALGLHRAVTVIEYLRLKGRLPSQMFKASSIGELQSLYPNDNFNNQLRNRTVVIRIIGARR